MDIELTIYRANNKYLKFYDKDKPLWVTKLSLKLLHQGYLEVYKSI